MTSERGPAGELTEAPVLKEANFLGVAGTFLKAVNAFNRQGLTAEQALERIKDLLDPKVKLYKIRSGESFPEAGSVLNYLAKVLPDQPIFAPVTSSLHPPSLPISVRGEAQWKRSASSPTLSIQYEFSFQPDPPHKITALWATPL